jgi:XRE family aerobic/anaerobic benzoate catabolism transcriptional regulator
MNTVGLTGHRVRQIRTSCGLTRRQLSSLSEVSERHLAHLELGNGNISLALLERVANALERTVSELVGGTLAIQSDEQRQMFDMIEQLNANEQCQVLDYLRGLVGSNAARNGRVALIGLRGAGKTTLGRLLADQREVPFIRLRYEVEQVAGMAVGEILELSGQEMFHHLEQQVLRETVATHSECVIETSGNIVADASLYDYLLANCTVVWLKAKPALHMQRVIHQGDLRPIANNKDAMAQLRRILNTREPLYERAHVTLNTSNQTVEKSLQSLSRQLLVRERTAGSPTT